MALRDHRLNGLRRQVTIFTVDPSQRHIEAVLPDGGPIYIPVWEVPFGFSWPQEGENWAVETYQGYWRLLGRTEDNTTTFPIEKLKVGEAKISGTKVYDGYGNLIAPITRGIQPLTFAASTTASVNVTHNLGFTPTNVQLTLNGAPTLQLTLGWDAPTTTQFTLHALAGSSNSSTINVAWTASP